MVNSCLESLLEIGLCLISNSAPMFTGTGNIELTLSAGSADVEPFDKLSLTARLGGLKIFEL